MSIITARGHDSSEAMDEIIRRLGHNAYILSTTARDGFVEIRATDTLKTAEQMRADAEGHEAQSDTRKNVSDAQTLPVEDVLATSYPAIRFDTTISHDPKEPSAPVASDQIVSDPPHKVRRVRPFSDLIGKRSDWEIKPSVCSPSLGVSEKKHLKEEVPSLNAIGGTPSALPSLAARTMIVGPPGSGKSMLAVRLAVHAMMAKPHLRPRFIAPRLSALLSEDRFDGMVRLLGVRAEHPLLGDMLQQKEAFGISVPEAPQIIDFSDIPDLAPEIVRLFMQENKTEVVLTLPAGLSARRTDDLLEVWKPLSPSVCFTFCDLCQPEPEQLELVAGRGMSVSRFVRGGGLVETLFVPSQQDLAWWMQEKKQATRTKGMETGE